MADTTNPKPTAEWEQIAAKKREALMQSIPSEWIIPDAIKPPDDQFNVMDFPRTSGWFSDRELEITGRDAVYILEMLRGREWTSEDVTRAFCKTAAAAHQLVRFDSTTRV
jgi:amidase